MAGQDEAVAALNTVNATLDKISGESSALLVEIQALKDAANNQGGLTAELQAAIDGVVARVQAIDALVPDAPVGGGDQDDDTVR